jgi:XTP/dITP diphosphohydrolase
MNDLRNDLSGGDGLYVITASDLLFGSIETVTCPILVTCIDTLDQVQALADWLSPQVVPTHPLTLISAEGVSTVQPIQDLDATDFGPFPLQAYVSFSHTAQAIAFQKLTNVVAQLRNPEGGCPWDLAQTPETLIPYIIEEAYETVDAIRQGDPTAIADELGDLLLQVVLQSQLASESQQFSLTEVAEGIAAKLIRRHPHVFGELQVNSIEEVHTNWEKIKAAEKGESEGIAEVLSHKLQRYARRLPPLMAGLKLSEKAAAAGFEWPDMNGVWAKFYEELSEFQEALLKGDPVEQEAELGDLIFTLVNIARWCEIDPTAALHQTNLKLIERIRLIESKAEKPLSEYALDDLEQLWQAAKQQLKAQLLSESEVASTSDVAANL